MFRSRLSRVGGVALSAALVAVGAASATSAGSSVPPDLASLALSPSDVPGSMVVYNGPLDVAGSPYVTMLVPNGGRSASLIEAVVTLARDAGSAADRLAALDRSARTRAGRLALAKMFADAASSLGSSAALRKDLHMSGAGKITKIAVGLPEMPSRSILVLPVIATISGESVYFRTAYVQVDRAIDAVELIQPEAPVSARALAPLIDAVKAHLSAGFTVANTAAPTIAGSAASGQTLTADVGEWSGGASSFGFAWQRCAADGTACVPIAGASSPSYLVTDADSGSTIRVIVSGSNTVSTAPATSAQTTVVA